MAQSGSALGPSSWFSEADAEKVFKEIPVETIAVYFGHGKEIFFLVRDTENRIFPLFTIVGLLSSQLAVFVQLRN